MKIFDLKKDPEITKSITDKVYPLVLSGVHVWGEPLCGVSLRIKKVIRRLL